MHSFMPENTHDVRALGRLHADDADWTLRATDAAAQVIDSENAIVMFESDITRTGVRVIAHGNRFVGSVP